MRIDDPASGQPIADVPEDDATSIARKVAQARAAQPAWAARGLAERTQILRRFRDLVVANREELARTLTREVGKPITQSRAELSALPARLDFFLEHTAGVLQDETVTSDGAMTERIRYEPLGVVANISAWNYPWFVSSNVFFPALLSGNAVAFKPSEFATLTGLAMQRLLHDSGVPQEVFATLVGDGSVGAQLLREPIDAVCFTGSYETGKKIACAVAPRLLKVQLELGGKDPVYVTDDVSIDAAAAAVADGAFYNAGQSCCAVERVYVHQNVHDAFVERFVAEVARFVVGEPMDERTYIGPLARAQQLSVLEEQVADALHKGARLLCGGRRMERPGNYFEPTVLSGADHSMKLMRDESFGPIIGLASVQSDQEALSLMQDTPYGLTAGVYCRDSGRAERILAQISAGSAYVNCCDRVSPRLPWSGRGWSGLGTTLSTLGIRSLVQPKAWHLRIA